MLEKLNTTSLFYSDTSDDHCLLFIACWNETEKLRCIQKNVNTLIFIFLVPQFSGSKVSISN